MKDEGVLLSIYHIKLRPGQLDIAYLEELKDLMWVRGCCNSFAKNPEFSRSSRSKRCNFAAIDEKLPKGDCQVY